MNRLDMIDIICDELRLTSESDWSLEKRAEAILNRIEIAGMYPPVPDGMSYSGVMVDDLTWDEE